MSTLNFALRGAWWDTLWQFDGDFILYNIPGERWVEPILHALVGPR